MCFFFFLTMSSEIARHTVGSQLHYQSEVWSLEGFVMFLEEVYNAHQGFICLIKITFYILIYFTLYLHGVFYN